MLLFYRACWTYSVCGLPLFFVCSWTLGWTEIGTWLLPHFEEFHQKRGQQRHTMRSFFSTSLLPDVWCGHTLITTRVCALCVVYGKHNVTKKKMLCVVYIYMYMYYVYTQQQQQKIIKQKKRWCVCVGVCYCHTYMPHNTLTVFCTWDLVDSASSHMLVSRT